MEDIRKVEQVLCEKLESIRNKINKKSIDYQQYDELQKQLRIIRYAKQIVMQTKYLEEVQ